MTGGWGDITANKDSSLPTMFNSTIDWVLV